ncbi:MAG: hypothetical protein U0T33_12500 [Bacteroidales bacterium]
MGTWGTAISSNDTYSDTYRIFFDLYNGGLDVGEISKKLIADNQETINDTEDCNNFWFALAKAQWECKQLDKDILDRVKKVIETGADLEVWRQLDADEKTIQKRKTALDNFLADLQKEIPKVKSRKKKLIRQPVFEKGDCLAFKLENGNYGGAVVLEAIKNDEYGHNLIATTRINQSNKPNKTDFENAEILVLNYASWDNKPVVQWYLPIRHKLTAHLIEKIDTIDVQIDFDIKNTMYGFVADFDIWIIQIVDQQLKSEETKPRSTTKKTIKELTIKSKRKLW